MVVRKRQLLWFASFRFHCKLIEFEIKIAMDPYQPKISFYTFSSWSSLVFGRFHSVAQDIHLQPFLWTIENIASILINKWCFLASFIADFPKWILLLFKRRKFEHSKSTCFKVIVSCHPSIVGYANVRIFYLFIRDLEIRYRKTFPFACCHQPSTYVFSSDDFISAQNWHPFYSERHIFSAFTWITERNGC